MTLTIANTSPLDLARHLAQHFAQTADEADQRGRMFHDDIRLLRDSGYLTLNVPRAYGGQGLSMRDTLTAHLELSQASASMGIIAGMTVHLFGHYRDTGYFAPPIFERLCEAVVAGGLFNAVASEPRMGSPSRGGQFETSATPHPDGWRINGTKTWVTGGKHLTHLLVKLRVEGEPALVLIPGDSPGMNWAATWTNALSLRASESDDLYLEDVIVPHDAMLKRGNLREAPNRWFPMVLASVYLGAAFAARNAVIQFALERVPTALGKPIASLPKIQRQIGEMDLGLQAARALLMEVADETDSPFARIAAAKHFAVETANRITDLALKVAGGQSLTNTLPLERYFRDTRAGSMQPPADDTALEMIGKAAIGDSVEDGTPKPISDE